MKIYIASHDRWAACHVATELEKAGHTVVSDWHTTGFFPTKDFTPEIRRQFADTDAQQVMESDAVVLIACRDKVPGGKFVEAGIALGAGKRVLVLGERENLLMWHPCVSQHDDMDSLEKALH